MRLVDPARVYTYFLKRFGLKKPSPKKWWSFDCPFCGGKKKHAVQFSIGICKCWTCDFRGTVVEFVQEFMECSATEAKVMLWAEDQGDIEIIDVDSLPSMTRADITLPLGFHSIDQGDNIIATRARNYLKKRGFDIDKLAAKGYGYCDERPEDHKENMSQDFFGYIIIPFYHNSKLVYYIGRDLIGNYLRYKNPPTDFVAVGKSDVIYNQEALYLYDSIAIMEGALDAETIGKTGTATLGWSMSPYQKAQYMKSPAKRLVFIPDAGADNMGRLFYHKAVEVAMDFLDTGKEIYVLDLNQVSAIGKDVNELGKKKVRELYRVTKPLTWEDAVEILAA